MAIDQRLLPMLVFLFSAAPLASLYALIGWAVWGSNGHSFLHVTYSSDPNSPFATVLHNSNATLEDLWSALFQERLTTTGASTTTPSNHNHVDTAFLMASGGIPHVRMQHWTILIPWLLSLILGFVVPCVLTLYSHVQRRRRNNHRGGRDNYLYNEVMDRFDRKVPRERRLNRILKSLQDFKKTLLPDDFLHLTGTSISDTVEKSQAVFDLRNVDESDNDESPREEGEEGTKLLMLPKPGYRLGDLLATVDDNKKYCRTVENMCPICLTQYVPGDSVVWSINPKCKHIFHETCLSSWLARKRKNPQCPCCRQLFLEAYQNEEKQSS
mmetsp:Transcript_8154/g.11747  ORF Transcript_8154/g.11747 Transcript_8154/m.11747 type:complete len:326 (+) Transcript_8154:189-1166(+)